MDEHLKSQNSNLKTASLRLKPVWLLVLLIVVVVVGGWGYYRMGKVITKTQKNSGITENGQLREIELGGHKLMVEVADEPAELEKGLGDRDEVSSDGMLFVMPTRMMPSFWMKGMRFDLDFLWIDCGPAEPVNEQRAMNNEQKTESAECRVVQVNEKVKAPENNGGKMEYISPEVPVTHVLEVEAGWVDEKGVFVGDEVKGL